MITVKFSGTGSDCPGLHLIDCTMGFNKASLCDGGITTSVYVSTAVSSISQAYSGGYPIYDSGDCTTCAPDGWYGNSPFSNVAYDWDRNECAWVTQEDCSSRNIMVRESGSSSKSCDGLGILHNVWIDGDNLLEATGMWSNSILTTTASVPSGRWYQDQQVGQDSYTRYWTNLGNGGQFGNTVLCNGDGPSPTTRYQMNLYYNQFNSANACTGTAVTYWSDNQNFSQATTLWTTETGSTFAPDGYYTLSITMIGGSNEVRQSINGSLSDTGVLCGGEEGPSEGFD